MEAENRAAGEGDTKICPRCAETIKAAATICRYCNTDLHADETARQGDAERMLFEGHPAVIYSVWQWLVVVLTLGIGYLYYAYQSLSVRYQISTQRIKIERGLLTRAKDSIEVFSFDHFDLISPLGMRLAGFCILQIRSADPGYPNITLYGIAELEKLADMLRECSLRERTRRRVVAVMQT